jgi:AbrB family looped-hinge helix DNA binding protein
LEDKVETSVITTKGQATIPAKIRRQLKVKPGDQIGFEVDKSGNVILRKCSRTEALWAKAMESTLASEWGNNRDDDL